MSAAPTPPGRRGLLRRAALAAAALAPLGACGRAGPPRQPGPKEAITYPRPYPARDPEAMPPAAPPGTGPTPPAR